MRNFLWYKEKSSIIDETKGKVNDGLVKNKCCCSEDIDGATAFTFKNDPARLNIRVSVARCLICAEVRNGNHGKICGKQS